jgi:TolB protein
MDAPDAQVWAVTADGARVVQLASASTGGDSWAKWAAQVYMNRGRALYWFTFSSRREIGLRPGGTSQIWMAAFDPAAGAEGDPSLPAFWLPFQDPASGNHIAQWVLRIDRQPCGETPCPGGEFCQDGFCVPDLI